MTISTAWTHKVVKMSRGMNGQWFAHRAAATFPEFASACAYARDFHAEQQAVLGVSDGHKYCVVSRRHGGQEMTYRLSVPAAKYPTD